MIATRPPNAGVQRRGAVGVRAQHVVVGDDVREAQRLCRLRVIADGEGVAAEFGLREDEAEVHNSNSTQRDFVFRQKISE